MKKLPSKYVEYTRDLLREKLEGVDIGRLDALEEVASFMESEKDYETFFNKAPCTVWLRILSSIEKSRAAAKEKEKNDK